MSSDEVVAHIGGLTAPDRIYWDARSLKKDGRKFQSMSWDIFPRVEKDARGEWVFKAEAPAPVALAPVAAPAEQPAAARAAAAIPAPQPAKVVDADAVLAAIEAAADDVRAWVAAGAQHPAPAAVRAVKDAAGCGWAQLQKLATAWATAPAAAPAAAVQSPAQRVRRAPACDVIDFTEAEKAAFYRGCNLHLATFEHNVLTGLHTPADELPYSEDEQDYLLAQRDWVLRWLNKTLAMPGVEVWLGECSCGQFCEPRRIELTDAAHVMRAFTDEHRRLEAA
jgi:hypothetical protein